MACACSKRRNMEYVWTASDGSRTITYPNKSMAKARVIRDGGSYTEQAKA